MKHQLVKRFSSVLSPMKIRVNMITLGRYPRPGKTKRPEFANGISARTPLGRIGPPEDLVEPVKFFFEDSSAVITGHNLIVDGGYSIYKSLFYLIRFFLTREFRLSKI